VNATHKSVRICRCRMRFVHADMFFGVLKYATYLDSSEARLRVRDCETSEIKCYGSHGRYGDTIENTLAGTTAFQTGNHMISVLDICEKTMRRPKVIPSRASLSFTFRISYRSSSRFIFTTMEISLERLLSPRFTIEDRYNRINTSRTVRWRNNIRENVT